MGRREIAASLFGILFTGGGGGMIAYPGIPAFSPYLQLLLVASAVAMVIGFGGLLYLLVSAPKKEKERRAPSSFIRGGKIGKLKARKVSSDAELFLENTEVEDASFDRVRHTPRPRD